MAIRFEPSRKSPWRVYWRNPFSGKLESETHLTEGEARKAESLIKHRLKYERESFRPDEISEESEPSVDNLTFDQAVFLYLKDKKPSRKGISTVTDCIRPSLKIIGSIPVAQIDRAVLQSLKAVLLKDTLVKSVTIRARLSVLRTILRWCAEQGFIEVCPQFPKLPPAHYEHFIPPTPEEIAAMMNAAPPHLQRVILLGSQMGLRIGPSELFKLTWADVDLIRGVVRVQAARKRPDQPWREVPIRESLLPIIKDWGKEDSALHCAYVIHYQGKPVLKIQTAWESMLERAGITRRIRPYDLRHAFGTEAIAAGVDIGTVAQMMGHNPAMLLTHYQHVADARKKAAVESLPDIPCMRKIVCTTK